MICKQSVDQNGQSKITILEQIQNSMWGISEKGWGLIIILFSRESLLPFSLSLQGIGRKQVGWMAQSKTVGKMQWIRLMKTFWWELLFL